MHGSKSVQTSTHRDTQTDSQSRSCLRTCVPEKQMQDVTPKLGMAMAKQYYDGIITRKKEQDNDTRLSTKNIIDNRKINGNFQKATVSAASYSSYTEYIGDCSLSVPGIVAFHVNFMHRSTKKESINIFIIVYCDPFQSDSKRKETDV